VAATDRFLPPSDDRGARDAWVASLEERFAPIASGLGLVFVLVVIGENLAQEGSTLESVFFVTGWAIWLVFVAEFVLRAIVAPSTSRFLRHNWWQTLFLLVPFLRFIAALRIARVARASRIVSSAVRGTRSAGQVLRDRVMWIATVHAIVVLAASQLLFEMGSAGQTYGETLHAVALASVSGEPLGIGTGLAQVLDVLLAFYSVAVFATAAGVLGAYFLDRTARDRASAGEGSR
jgi:voltage-gated potassium channel